jgi:3-hydroxyisobutyrate dehydrogenase-like beta-hydroxyacid dehydrogenase
MASVERVAFLGMGIMGSRMAANLARAGFELSVWNRTRERADEVAHAHGARVAATPAQAAAGADAVVTMVVDSPQVEEVLFGPDGAVDGLNPGALAIDMSTIAPSAARALAERLAERGLGFLDAPVSGSKPKAQDGTLTIMVGAEADAYERALQLFEAMGEVVVHVGRVGHGQVVKVLNNTLAAVNTAALAEAVTVARDAGVDLDALVRVVAASSGASTMLELKVAPMRERDFEPLFRLGHMLKDVRLALATAAELGVEPRVARAAERLYAEAEAGGHGEDDFAAVVEAVERSRA